MVPRLAVRVATPPASVIALPTEFRFTKKLMVSPTAGELSDFFRKVAERTALPPNAPVAGATVMVATAGWVAVMVEEAELLAVFGSTADELLMLAVLVMIAPFATVLLTRPARVTVAVAPLANEGKLTRRLLRVPRQTPPFVAAQDTKLTVEGMVSARLNAAAAGPLLRMLMEYVTVLL